VLSYARVAKNGTAVMVALNMSPAPQVVSLDVEAAGVKRGKLRTLMVSPSSMARPASAERIELPPFGAWVGAQ
jgi:hypothetical protein